MRILLDEGVNPRLRLAFPGDEVKTVPEMGWRSLTNGKLMKEAAPQFDVFVTLDRNLQFQNPTGKQGWASLFWSPDSTTLRHTGRSLRKFETWLGKRSLDRSTYFEFGSQLSGSPSLLS